MKQLILPALAATLVALGTSGPVAADSTSNGARSFPRYEHVFLIVEENHGVSQIIGNPAAPEPAH